MNQKKLYNIYNRYNLFLLTSVPVIWYRNVLLILCASKWYVEYLYRHIFLTLSGPLSRIRDTRVCQLRPLARVRDSGNFHQ